MSIPVPPGNNWTNTSNFECVGVHRLPFHGNEILFMTVIYLAMIAVYCVTFIDVALKQAWPEKFLDSEVMKRVKKLQSDFPLINQNNKKKGALLAKKKAASDESEVEEEDDAPLAWENTVKVRKADGTLAEIQYDEIVSQEPYIATCCVDEDLTFQLANGKTFGTVSSYCSCTVRGYAMLSTMLPMASTFLGFCWVHNAMIYPIGDNYARYLSGFGYFLCFFTGIIMCGPNSSSVYRNRNILLWDSVKTDSKLLDFHTIGIVGFCLVPMIGNLLQILFAGPYLPNRKAMIAGIAGQVFGLIVFAGPSLLQKMHKLTGNQANIIAIIGEIIAVMASMMTFAQIETYSAAACAQLLQSYDTALFGAMLGTLATLVVKHYAGAPVAPYANGPSVLLKQNGQPVAVSGTVPVLNYDRVTAFLPTVQPQGE